MEQNFCRRCGSALTKNGAVYTCASNHTLFSNPAPTVGVFFIDDSGSIVLSVRAIEPGLGKLDTVGGFVDENENFEEALLREITEETGLTQADFGKLSYLTSAPSTYQYDNETRAVLSCFYYTKLKKHAQLRASDDVARFVYVHPTELSPEDMWSQDTRRGVQKLLEVIT